MYQGRSDPLRGARSASGADRIIEKIVEIEIEKDEAVRELGKLTGSTKFESQK